MNDKEYWLHMNGKAYACCQVKVTEHASGDEVFNGDTNELGALLERDYDASGLVARFGNLLYECYQCSDKSWCAVIRPVYDSPTTLHTGTIYACLDACEEHAMGKKGTNDAK